jgi:hypothetical protein
MESEEKVAIAFLFKRSGKNEISLSEFCLSLSMDLNWFSPTQAKDFVKHALQRRILMKEGSRIKPNFDWKNIAVPVGFRPSPQIFEEENKEEGQKETPDVTNMLVQRIVEKTAKDEQSVVEQIKSIERKKNICFDIAALMLSEEYGVSLDVYFVDVEKKLFRENRE